MISVSKIWIDLKVWNGHFTLKMVIYMFSYESIHYIHKLLIQNPFALKYEASYFTFSLSVIIYWADIQGHSGLFAMYKGVKY